MNGKKFLFALFLLTACTYIGADLLGTAHLRTFLKPLLMPTLALWVYFSAPNERIRNTFLAGLLFSTLGDVLLMYQGSGWFLGGLAAFLCAHLSYIAAFIQIRGLKSGYVAKNPAIIVLLLVYLCGFLYYLIPYLPGAMRLPVTAYGAVITLMAAAAVNLKGFMDPKAWQSLTLGAALFVASDSILATAKFAVPVPGASLWIMITYIGGQALLAYGVVKR